MAIGTFFLGFLNSPPSDIATSHPVKAKKISGMTLSPTRNSAPRERSEKTSSTESKPEEGVTINPQTINATSRDMDKIEAALPNWLARFGVRKFAAIARVIISPAENPASKPKPACNA